MSLFHWWTNCLRSHHASRTCSWIRGLRRWWTFRMALHYLLFMGPSQSHFAQDLCFVLLSLPGVLFCLAQLLRTESSIFVVYFSGILSLWTPTVFVLFLFGTQSIPFLMESSWVMELQLPVHYFYPKVCCSYKWFIMQITLF